MRLLLEQQTLTTVCHQHTESAVMVLDNTDHTEISPDPFYHLNLGLRKGSLSSSLDVF